MSPIPPPKPGGDDTPVATIRPIPPGEIAGVDDLVAFDGFGGRRRRRQSTRVVRRILLVLVLLAAGYYALTLFQVWRTGRSDEARAVDAIVVMGAAQYDGRPSPQLAARLDHVVSLYSDGVAPVVVVTGGKQGEDRFTEAEASAGYLVERGVPESAILREDEGRSTFESVEAVAELLTEHGLQTVVVVTDPFHSLRSRMIAEHVGIEAYVSPTPTSVITGANELRRHLVEAGGVSIGRIIGFDRI